MADAKPNPWQIAAEKANRLREFIQRKKTLRDAYRAVFLGRDGKPTVHGGRVLAHLYRFSGRGDTAMRKDSTGRVDPLALAYCQGQRDLYETIQLHLGLDDSDLYALSRAERAEQPPKE